MKRFTAEVRATAAAGGERRGVEDEEEGRGGAGAEGRGSGRQRARGSPTRVPGSGAARRGEEGVLAAAASG